ncbi:MAG: MBL fold metallo-hydrolase, partial [Myxococcales bacterium]|nr:MBL fold metallo-hydrolase [Myxococcales bacterium]
MLESAREQTDSLFVLPQDVVFPTDLFPLLLLVAHPQVGDFGLEVKDAEGLRALRQVFGQQWEDADEDSLAYRLGKALAKRGYLVARDSLPPPQLSFDAPGIYRLQHASLLFRSESSAVITDPQFAFATEQSWIGQHSLPAVDAILISHSHGDHFCPVSLMHFPRDTPIVVPRVAARSMLAEDMAHLLREAGFTKVIEAGWHESLTFGDIAVRTYPFYGEQPWITFGSPVEAFRNVGNTYVVQSAGTTSWFLIDSGHEHGHSMSDVCREVVETHGRIDLVLSNLRIFRWHSGQIDGTGRYLFCFPLDKLAAPSTWPDDQLMTFTPAEMRHFLRQAQPTYFLPYAHWWQPREAGPHVVDEVRNEDEMLQAVRGDGADALRCTELLRWNVGSRARIEGSRITIQQPSR